VFGLPAESVFGLLRNQCSACRGISVRLGAEYARGWAAVRWFRVATMNSRWFVAPTPIPSSLCLTSRFES